MENTSESLEPFIHRKVVVLPEHSTAFQAARAMCANGVGCVVVSDRHGNIEGVVTDRDIACSIVAGDLTPACELSEFMSRPAVAVSASATLGQVIEVMESHGLRRVPVLSDLRPGHQKCLGLVTLDDLIAGNAIEPWRASRIVQAQIRSRNAPHLRQLKQEAGDFESLLSRFENRASLDPETARAVAIFILSALVRRLNYSAAIAFIALTPAEIHRYLLSLPPGPDRSLDALSLVAGVLSHMGGNEEDARETMTKFWSTLAEFADKQELDHTMTQLPSGIRQLFSGPTPQWISENPRVMA